MLSARMFERVVYASSAAAAPSATDEGTRMFFIRAYELGWHSLGYFSVAIDRKVTRLEGETEC